MRNLPSSGFRAATGTGPKVMTGSSAAAARAVIEEWPRLRKRGEMAGAVQGLRVQGWEGARRVDRRSVRHARALVALAEAIEERERRR